MSSTSFEEIKLIAIVNWTLHVSEFWRSIIIFYYIPLVHGCSFVAKLIWKLSICAFYKMYIICRKRCFYTGKKFYTEKKFFTEKNIYENLKNISLIWEIYFYTENVCVTNKT